MVLASGQRAGFFIGDGAGVGKGRQVGMVPYRKQNSHLLNSCGLLPWRHKQTNTSSACVGYFIMLRTLLFPRVVAHVRFNCI